MSVQVYLIINLVLKLVETLAVIHVSTFEVEFYFVQLVRLEVILREEYLMLVELYA